MRIVFALLGSALLLLVAFQYATRWLLGDAVQEMAERAHAHPAELASRPGFKP